MRQTQYGMSIMLLALSLLFIKHKSPSSQPLLPGWTLSETQDRSSSLATAAWTRGVFLTPRQPILELVSGCCPEGLEKRNWASQALFLIL